jgi:hypothetical protein
MLRYRHSDQLAASQSSSVQRVARLHMIYVRIRVTNAPDIHEYIRYEKIESFVISNIIKKHRLVGPRTID